MPLQAWREGLVLVAEGQQSEGRRVPGTQGLALTRYNSGSYETGCGDQDALA